MSSADVFWRAKPQFGGGFRERCGDVASAGDVPAMHARLARDVDLAYDGRISDGFVEVMLASGLRFDLITIGVRPEVAFADNPYQNDLVFWEGTLPAGGELPAGWWFPEVSRYDAARQDPAAIVALVERGVLRDASLTFSASSAEELAVLERAVASWVMSVADQALAANVEVLQLTDPYRSGKNEILVLFSTSRFVRGAADASQQWYRLHESGIDWLRRFAIDADGALTPEDPAGTVGHLSWALDGSTIVVSTACVEVLRSVGARGCEVAEIPDDSGYNTGETAWRLDVTRTGVEVDWARAEQRWYAGAPTSEVIGLPAAVEACSDIDLCIADDGSLLARGTLVEAFAEAGLLTSAANGDDPAEQSMYATAVERVRTRRTAPQLQAAGMQAPDYLWTREPPALRPPHLH